MKNKHRIKQGLSLLLAGGIALTNPGAALPAFAENAVCCTSKCTAKRSCRDSKTAYLL